MPTPRRLKVINLFGSPGVGKSTVRSGLFWLLKSHHVSVEEVAEYAKYLVHSGQLSRLREEQTACLAEQIHRQRILREHYVYAITDSPLLLQPFYAPPAEQPALLQLAQAAAAQFDNLNFYLTRDLLNDAFDVAGRVHDRADALRLDRELRAYLAAAGVRYQEVPVDAHTPWALAERLCPGAIAAP